MQVLCSFCSASTVFTDWCIYYVPCLVQVLCSLIDASTVFPLLGASIVFIAWHKYSVHGWCKYHVHGWYKFCLQNGACIAFTDWCKE